MPLDPGSVPLHTKTGVPMLVVQTWKTKTMPLDWQPSPESFARHMPGWQHLITTDEENQAFVARWFPDYLPTYMAFPHNIQRVDAWRYCWLYVMGGMYCDGDIAITQSLEPLLEMTMEPGTTQVWLPRSPNFGHVLTNCLMASVRHAPVWLRVLRATQLPPPLFAAGKHMVVMTTTGAGMLQRTLGQNLLEEGVVAVLPTHLVMPCSVCHAQPCKPTADTYAKALPGGGTWTGSDTGIINSVFCAVDRAFNTASRTTRPVSVATGTALLCAAVTMILVAAWLALALIGLGLRRLPALVPAWSSPAGSAE